MNIFGKLTIPNAWLKLANAQLNRLSAIDLKYERLTVALRGRSNGDDGGPEKRLRERHVRERKQDETAYTVSHERMSNFILNDLTSTAPAEPRKTSRRHESGSIQPTLLEEPT
ncbi:hypothetical protein [Alsobacter sp. R-9]